MYVQTCITNAAKHMHVKTRQWHTCIPRFDLCEIIGYKVPKSTEKLDCRFLKQLESSSVANSDI